MGVSVGVERVFTVLERQALRQAEELGAGIRESKTQVRASFTLATICLTDEIWFSLDGEPGWSAAEYGIRESKTQVSA